MLRFLGPGLRLDKRRPAFLLVLIALTFVVTAAIAIGRGSLSGASATNPQNDKSTEVEMVTLRPWGFEPAQITRPPGPFALVVENRSEFEPIDVSLDVESGPKLHALGLSKSKTKWRQKLVLTPGTYRLREASHPEWSCLITVQP